MMPVHRHRDNQTLNWASNPVYASKHDGAPAKELSRNNWFFTTCSAILNG